MKSEKSGTGDMVKFEYDSGYSDCLHDLLAWADDPLKETFFRFIKVNQKSLCGLINFFIKYRHRFFMCKQTFEVKARWTDKKKTSLEFSPAESELREQVDYKGGIDLINAERRTAFMATGDKFYEGDIA